MINEELFNNFLQNRIEITGKKKINTDLAVQKLRKKLTDWENTGFNIDHIIEHAIEQGWRGLYLPHGATPKQKHLRPNRDVKDLLSGIGKPIPRVRTGHAQASSVREQGKALAKAEKIGGARAALDAMKELMRK